jgi:hypothetical protein
MNIKAIEYIHLYLHLEMSDPKYVQTDCQNLTSSLAKSFLPNAIPVRVKYVSLAVLTGHTHSTYIFGLNL